MFDDLIKKLFPPKDGQEKEQPPKTGIFSAFQELTSGFLSKKNLNESLNQGKEQEKVGVVSKAQNQRSLLIKVFAGAVIIFFIYDEYFVEKESVQVTQPTPKIKSVRKKINSPTPTDQTDTPVETAVGVDVKPTAEQLEEIKKIRNGGDSTNSEQAIKEDEKLDYSNQEVSTFDTNVDTSKDSPVDENQTPPSETFDSTSNLNSGSLTPEPTEFVQEEAINEIINKVDDEKPEIKADLPIEEAKKDNVEITQKPIETKSFPTPNYERVGRGLVYNCNGRHWACVDRENYFRCVRSNKYSVENNTHVDCYPSDVYASEEDCKTMQIHNVNTVNSTPFCNK